LILFDIYFGIVGAEVLDIQFVRMDLVPIAIGFCGVLLLTVGGLSLVEEKNKTKVQQVKENDERNITIVQTSKSKAYDLLASLFPFDLFVLAMFGYMNNVSFFLLVGIYYICIVYYAYHLYKNKKEM